MKQRKRCSFQQRSESSFCKITFNQKNGFQDDISSRNRRVWKATYTQGATLSTDETCCFACAGLALVCRAAILQNWSHSVTQDEGLTVYTNSVTITQFLTEVSMFQSIFSYAVSWGSSVCCKSHSETAWNITCQTERVWVRTALDCTSQSAWWSFHLWVLVRARLLWLALLWARPPLQSAFSLGIDRWLAGPIIYQILQSGAAQLGLLIDMRLTFLHKFYLTLFYLLH